MKKRPRGVQSYKVAWVQWDDSCSQRGWERIAEVKQRMAIPCLCESVGFVIGRDREHVFMAHSIDPMNDHLNMGMHIPSSAIRDFKILGEIVVPKVRPPKTLWRWYPTAKG